MKTEQLRAELKSRNLDDAGTKREPQHRLAEELEQLAAAAFAEQGGKKKKNQKKGGKAESDAEAELSQAQQDKLAAKAAKAKKKNKGKKKNKTDKKGQSDEFENPLAPTLPTLD